MAKRRHDFFSALGPETEEKIKLANNKIRFDLWFSKDDSCGFIVYFDSQLCKL